MSFLHLSGTTDVTSASLSDLFFIALWTYCTCIGVLVARTREGKASGDSIRWCLLRSSLLLVPWVKGKCQVTSLAASIVYLVTSEVTADEEKARDLLFM